MDQRFSREATARWSRIGNSGIVGESELSAQSCSRGATTYSEDDDKALGVSSAGTNAGHGGGLFFIWWSAALRMRGSSRKFDHLARVRYSLPGVDPTQGDVGTRACATTANRAPSIHMQLGCSSHTLKRCLAKRTQHICERRSTLLNGTGGNYHLWLHPLSFHKLHPHSDGRKGPTIIVQVGGIGRIGSL
jgi:hypothetical protein